MQADIRYYLQIVKESDSGDETIYQNTKKLIAKKMQNNSQGVLCQDNLPLPDDYIDTTWFFCNNSQMTAKKKTIQDRLKMLTNNSELVIRGHGDVSNNKVSKVSAAVLARSLIDLGLNCSCRINITGCNLGRNSNVKGSERGTKSASDVGTGSFAHMFQKELYEYNQKKLTCVVHARTSSVGVEDDGSKITWDFDDGGNTSNKQAHSKIVFNINNMGVQTMIFAY